MKLYSLLPVLVAVAGGSAMADMAGSSDGIRLGQPSYGGTGCPAGSASTLLSPDAQSLSILFDSFQVEAGGMSGRQIDRKSCNIAVPVTIPQGYSVSVLQIDYRGFNALPSGALSRFNVEYFFAGTQGPTFSREFFGPMSEDFTIGNRLVAESVVWSACGADVNLRANTSMMVQTNRFNEQAMSSVDSADVQASVVFQLQWKRCNGGAPTPYPDPHPAPAPTYPPTPLPPSPPPSYSDCSVDTVTDYYGRTTYRVTDRFGRVLGEYRSFYEAQDAQRMFESRGMCSGNGGGYDPRPNPRPTPVPPPNYGRGFVCTVQTQFGQFSGSGNTANAATAQARTSCIHAGNTSFTCNRAPVSCYRR